MGDRRQTLLRFLSGRSHPDTGMEEGIFCAAGDLRDCTLISVSDRQLLESLLSWFAANLATPERFNRSKSKGYYRRRTQGISWLKSSAIEHVAKMHALLAPSSRTTDIEYLRLRPTGRDTLSLKMTIKWLQSRFVAPRNSDSRFSVIATRGHVGFLLC